MLRTRFQPLHPVAWWSWAGALAVAASRTTNLLLLGLILAVVALVVSARRGDNPWARSFGALLRLGVLVILIRMTIQVLFGNRVPGDTWFTLPSVPLPHWAAGVTIGGQVTAQAVLGALCQGLQIAVILACFGAAKLAGQLVSPSAVRARRALRSSGSRDRRDLVHPAGRALGCPRTRRPSSARTGDYGATPRISRPGCPRP